jgi:hypothetical protein
MTLDTAAHFLVASGSGGNEYHLFATGDGAP